MPSTIRMRRLPASAAALVLAGAALLAAEAPSTFTGTPLEQARSLLRPVLPYGKLGPQRPLPRFLERLLSGGEPLRARSRVAARLAALGRKPAEVGGDPAAPVEKARYFVIHDTSYPYYADDPLPDNATLESPDWKGNNLAMWEKIKVTHVYVNRRGESVTARDFAEPMRATKYERGDIPNRAGLFLHVELVQPRRRDPQGGPKNDAIAPEPGFTGAQLKRLALLYLTASARRGEWLIPAFHAAVDAGIPDAHDDPQRFSLEDWSAALQQELGAIR